MVQIIDENRQPSFMQAILGGAAQGIPPALEKLSQHNQLQQQNALAMQMARQKEQAELKKALQVQELKQSGKTQQLKEQQEMFSKLFQPQNGSNNHRLGTGTTQDSAQEQFDPSVWSDEAIAQAAIINPAVGREMRAAKDAAQKEKTEDKKLREKKKAALREETLPVKKEIAERAQNARMGIENKERLIELIEKGNIDDPTFAALADALPLNLGKRLLSPDTVEYKAGLIDEYKDLRQIFQGQTRIKEIELLEAKTADLYLTDSQKKAILNSRVNALKADLIREEAAAELEEEEKDYSLLQYRKEVEKRAKPKLEALFHRILDEQKATIQDAENMKKGALDYDDPEGRIILEQILKEAGGDRSKARQIAKKKGYTIGK